MQPPIRLPGNYLIAKRWCSIKGKVWEKLYTQVRRALPDRKKGTINLMGHNVSFLRRGRNTYLHCVQSQRQQIMYHALKTHEPYSVQHLKNFKIRCSWCGQRGVYLPAQTGLPAEYCSEDHKRLSLKFRQTSDYATTQERSCPTRQN